MSDRLRRKLAVLLAVCATVTVIAVLPASSSASPVLVKGETVSPTRTAIVDMAVIDLSPEQLELERGTEDESDEGLIVPNNRAVPAGTAVTGPAPVASGGGFSLAPEPDAPSVASNFQGPADSGWYPPDVNGAVGPSHVVSTLNGTFEVRNRAGGVLTSTTLASFWSGLGHTDIFDPHVVYDQLTSRFLTCAVATRTSASSALLVGISNSSDPTGAWTIYSYDADSANAGWADYPSMAYYSGRMTASVNLFSISSGAFLESRVWDFPATNLSTASVYDLDNTNWGFTIVPAQSYSATSIGYMVSGWNSNSGGNGYLRLYKIDAGTMYALGYPSAPGGWNGGQGNFGPQSGSSTKIDTGDDRIMNAVYRNGYVWTAHTIFLPVSSPTHSLAQWWQIDTGSNVTQRGRVEDTGATTFYSYPSIAVNANNDALIGYAKMSSSTYAASGWSFRYASDSANTTPYSGTVKSGESKYVKTGTGTRNRWGDYTATMVDPVNDTDFWTYQEYAWTPNGSTDRWSTWWARIAGNAAPAASVSPSSISFGSSNVGTQTSSQAVTVTSTGTSNLVVSSITKGGSFPNDFPITSNGCNGATLSPGQTCTVNVAFSPTAGGSRSASLLVNSNAAQVSASLSGTGVALVPGRTVSPSSLSFGSVGIGAQSSSQSVTVTSTGNTNLNISGVSLGGTNPGDYLTTSNTCTGASLSNGQTCFVSVAFRPTVTGSRTATLSITSNAATASVPLSGTGLSDGQPPVSSFDTANDSAVVAVVQRVTGTITDNLSGVTSAAVTFTNTFTAAVTPGTATLTCNPSRTSCGFAVTVPLVPGFYTVNVQGTDTAGNHESPGPTISIIVV